MVLCGIGVCLEKMERIEDALGWYNRALEIDPLLSDAWYGLGVCYELQGNYPDSINNLRKAVELSPESEEYWFSLAEALERDEQTDPAIDAYQQALAIDMAYFEARAQLMNLYFRLGRSDAAFQLFGEGQRLHPAEADFYYRSLPCYCDIILSKKHWFSSKRP